MDRIAVVILNFNNYEDTVDCIDRIVGCEQLDIILVDNASEDGSGDLAAKQYGDSIHYIQTGRNAGYAAGNNVGIKFAKEALCDKYICLLNNDTLPSPDLFGRLKLCLEEHPSCAFVGPVLLEMTSENIVQSAGADIFISKGDVPIRHSGEKYEVEERVEECGYVGGACIMFRSKEIEVYGYIPECYFLYFEETEWCLNASRLGMSVLCDWRCSLIHKGSATVSQHRDLGAYFMMRSRALFVKRNGSLIQRAAFLALWSLNIVARKLLKQQDCLWELSAILDGLRGRIDPAFSHLEIPS